MSRRVAIFLFALGFAAQASAELELVPPAELNDRVEDVRDAVKAPDFNPENVHHLGQVLEGQAHLVNHLPVDAGIGRWEQARRFNRSGEEATAEQMVATYQRILADEPPAPFMEGEIGKRVARDYGRLAQDFTSFSELVAARGVRKDEHGELGEGVAAAWVWNVAKAAKEGAVEGVMLAQPLLWEASKLMGEFVLATFGAHEPRHREQNKETPDALADQVKLSEVAAFRDEGALLWYMDPSGKKLMWLWHVTVEREDTPDFVKNYVKHLVEVRWAYSQGDEALKKLVDSRGYQDKKGLWAYHKHAEHDAKHAD